MNAIASQEHQVPHRSLRTQGQLYIVSASIALALAVPNLCAEEWGPNLEAFGIFSDERTVGGFEFLAPIRQDERNLTFAEIKAHVSDRRSQELNVGVGHRWINPRNTWIFGGFAQYDRRSTRNHNNFDQLTLGLEGLGSGFDARLNYYHPLSDEKRVAGFVGGIQYSGYRTVTQDSYEEVLKGWDGEVGALLPFSDSVETRLYAGAYHLDGDITGSETGWKTRLEVRPRKSLIFEVGYRDDDVFGSQTTFQVRYAFGYPWDSGTRTLRERMIQPTKRDLDVLVTPPEDTLVDVTLNNNTIHIDNIRGTSGGDGSFERPYASVDTCVANRCSARQGATGGKGALIRFWRGGSTLRAPYGSAGPWNLANGQTLWGEGWVVEPKPTEDPDYVNWFAQGVFDASRSPWFSPGGNGPGLVLADSNEVTGLAINVEGYSDFGPTADGFIPGRIGIYGDNISEFSIHDNVVRSGSGGIVLFNSSGEGAGRIAHNKIELTAPTEAQSGERAAVVFINQARKTAARQSILFDGNEINESSSGSAGDSSIVTYGLFANNAANGRNTHAQQYLRLAGNRISASDRGVIISNEAGEGAASTQEVSIENTSSHARRDGIFISNLADLDGSASQTVDIDGASVTSTDWVGIGVENIAFNGGASRQNVSIRNSSSYALDTGILLYNLADINGSASQTVNIEGVTVTSADDIGLFVLNDAANGAESMQDVSIRNSSSDAMNNGILLYNLADINGFASQTADIEWVSATSAGDIGLFVLNDATNGAEAMQDVSITNSSSDALDTGILLYNLADINGFASQTADIEGVTVTSTDDIGLFVLNDATNGAESMQDVSIRNSSSDAENEGILLYNLADTNASAFQTVDIEGVFTTSTDETGIFMVNDASDGTSYAVQTAAIDDAQIRGDAFGFFAQSTSLGESNASQLASIENSGIEGDTGAVAYGWASGSGASVSQVIMLKESQISAANIGVDVFADADSAGNVTQIIDLSSGNSILAPTPIVVDRGLGTGNVTQKIAAP